MPLPYRTLLHLGDGSNAINIAKQELERWLTDRNKVDPNRRAGFLTGAFFEPGFHELSSSVSLAVALRDERSGRQSAGFRLREQTPNGRYQVEIIAIDEPGNGRDGALLVDGTRLDAPDADGQVDPPGFIQTLLGRGAVYDSRALVTEQPRLIDTDDVAELVEAILDPKRSISVIVGHVFDPRIHASYVDIVDALTSKVRGVSSVAVLKQSAFDAFNDAMPEGFGLEPGRIRTYLAQVDPTLPSEPRRHRILSPERLSRALRRGHLPKSSPLVNVFAAETREPMLTAELPNRVRRVRLELTDVLNTLVRTEAIERTVTEQRAAHAAQPRVTDHGTGTDRGLEATTVARSLFDRLRGFVQRWLGSDDAVTEEALDLIDERLESAEASASRLDDELRQVQQRMHDFHSVNEELQRHLDRRDSEITDAEADTARLQNEVLRLRRRLVELDRAADAYASGDALWDSPPDDLTALGIWLSSDESDHGRAIREYVQMDERALDPIDDLERQHAASLYLTRCWEFTHALYDYARCVSAGEFRGSVNEYLISSEHTGYKVTPKRHAGGESKLTMDQFGDERVLPVPVSLDPRGTIEMTAHFKIDQQNTIAPRMYYFNDTAGSGRIYVGYIGKHKSNTKTSNA
jgi:hypothetical protein